MRPNKKEPAFEILNEAHRLANKYLGLILNARTAWLNANFSTILEIQLPPLQHLLPGVPKKLYPILRLDFGTEKILISEMLGFSDPRDRIFEELHRMQQNVFFWTWLQYRHRYFTYGTGIGTLLTVLIHLILRCFPISAQDFEVDR